MDTKDEFFESIVEEHRDKIYRICRYYVQDDDDVKDLYQETLINIWKGIDKFRGEAAISTWIFRVTANTAMYFLSKRKAKMNTKCEIDLIENQTFSEEDSRLEDEKLLHQSISKLPLVDMIIISLVLEGVPSKEIAEIIGLTDSNVRTRTHRIKATLKNIIEGRES